MHLFHFALNIVQNVYYVFILQETLQKGQLHIWPEKVLLWKIIKERLKKSKSTDKIGICKHQNVNNNLHH